MTLLVTVDIAIHVGELVSHFTEIIIFINRSTNIYFNLKGFDELRCRCGASVRYPPIECGTRPPACSKPCTEIRLCGHQPLHNCHPAPSSCPPCAVLTQKYCFGRHEVNKFNFNFYNLRMFCGL